jgi:hypothetical protein
MVIPEDNSLPKNYYATKSLTSKLGLLNCSIHACEKGCILFRHEHSEALRCSKCGGPRYWDEDRKMFLVTFQLFQDFIECSVVLAGPNSCSSTWRIAMTRRGVTIL